jgi:secondary thiamine-phosphate synthase enzyme
VQRDFEDFLDRLVPEDPSAHRHRSEGPDDVPAHIRGTLTATSLLIPVHGGRLLLGAWQGLYLYEHRRRPTDRQAALHLISE